MILILLLSGLVFCFDITSPLGYAFGLYYVILASLWSHSYPHPQLFNILVTALLLIGYMFSPEGVESAAIHNRLSAIIALPIIAHRRR